MKQIVSSLSSLLALLLMSFFQRANLVNVNVQFFLKHGDCNWSSFKSQKRSVRAYIVLLWHVTEIIKTVQKILSKQKPSVQWHRTHCILVYVAVSVARTVSRPVITIRASYSTGRNADPELWVWVTGWRGKGRQVQVCWIISRRQPIKVILQI